MKPSTPALIVYLISSFLAVIGIVMKNDILALLMKPVIVPSMFFYYLQTRKTKVNWLFLAAMLSGFIGDMIILFHLENGDIPVVLLNLFMYLIFFYFAIKDLPYKGLTVFNFVYFTLIITCFLAVLYFVLDLMTGLDSFMHYLLVVYGILLSLLASVIVFNHIKLLRLRTFYAVIMCICFVTSDIFFAISNFYLQMDIFVVFNVTVQFASYYYMVKYITCDEIRKVEV